MSTPTPHTPLTAASSHAEEAQKCADLQVLANARELTAAQSRWAQRLAAAGLHDPEIFVEPLSLGCEPDNMLVTEYEMRHGTPPITQTLHRVIVNARTALADADMTRAVVDCLPADATWYGTTRAGRAEPGSGAACNVRL
ncbi:hypothetical protein C1Y63_00360 [Corynebacterium sp. 13CS0277]|uniref:hypothetical protein n=1 Tax=Corynebacterium sp. 13CS0277 TaxID=2071994 RepID=UPI000D039422|nr:hypothetical protein [Corynebacterium sp. 13CS0277]PRQ12551.1 hypothetical protein C1Y63_00360 [Corynebacterium sp. 13CS0277]